MDSSLQSSSVADVFSPADGRRMTIIRPPSLSRLGLFDNLAELAHYKDLLYTLTVHRIKVRYKQSLLGATWAIIQPLSMMLIFTVVFSLIARVPSDGAPYALFAYVALLPWNYFSTAIASSTGGLVSHSQLVTKVYFPREILPLTYVLAALFDFLIASIVLGALLLYYRVPLTLNAFYALPIIIVLTLFATAIALFFSATQVRFRDVGVAVPLLIQLWMFATPIIYPLSAVPAHLLPLYKLNPMVGVIDNFRRVMLHRAPPDFSSLATSALISIALLIASYLYFKRVEATMADMI
jgi:lipopolysaccharide transport system permease protein